MQDTFNVFNGVDDPRRGNATRHDLQEMLTIAFPFFLSGGRNRPGMERFGRMKEGFPPRFMSPGTESRATTPSPTSSTRLLRRGRAASSPGCCPTGGHGPAT